MVNTTTLDSSRYPFTMSVKSGGSYTVKIKFASKRCVVQENIHDE